MAGVRPADWTPFVGGGGWEGMSEMDRECTVLNW